MVFSEEQKAAIYYKDGPALVLAGPGSGKTTVIVNRIERLIRVYWRLWLQVLFRWLFRVRGNIWLINPAVS